MVTHMPASCSETPHAVYTFFKICPMTQIPPPTAKASTESFTFGDSLENSLTICP